MHLICNSVIFSSTSVSEWDIFAATSDFLTGAPFNKTRLTHPPSGGIWDTTFGASVIPRLERLQNSTSVVRLENDACWAAYDTTLVSKWGDVLLISTKLSTNDSSSSPGPGGGASGLCDTLIEDDAEKCSENSRPDLNNWPLAGGPDYSWLNQPGNGKVSHCMAEVIQEHCKMRLSMPFIYTVIACNFVKMIYIWIIFWKLDCHPLVTIGDAIASFLDSPGMSILLFTSNIDFYAGNVGH